ncbi:MAG: IS5 family transposase [Patescibacteria group bacterium]
MLQNTTVTDSQMEYINFFLPQVKTKPLKYNYQAIISAIFYLTKTGCQWRELPPNFPPWETVYYHFRKLTRIGFWRTLLYWFRGMVRQQQGHFYPSSKLLIVDSQSIKSTSTCFTRGIDGNKKVKGLKVHLLVDILGLPHQIVVTTANVHDSRGVLLLLEKAYGNISFLKKIYADKAYRGIQDKVNKYTSAKIAIPKRNKKFKSGFNIYPKRWVVERTFAWLGKNRRFSKIYEGSEETLEALIQVAFIRLCLNRITKGLSKRY